MGTDVGMVLIHGAGLGGFIWDDVVSRVQRPALRADFPNRGRGGRANRALTLGDYTDAVVRSVEQWDCDRVVLVAHSIGGCVALEVAERLGHRIAAIVGIGAAFPRSGESFISCLPFPQRLVMPWLLRAFGTKPPVKSIEQSLCADLTEEACSKVVERFTPESRSLYTDPVRYSSLPAERWYVRLTRDGDLPPAVQGAMIANIEATRVVDLDSGHLPMISRPADIARILSELPSRDI